VTELVVNGREVPVKIRRNARAKRISLRVDPQDGAVVLILPPHLAQNQGLAFAKSKAGWLAERLAALPASIPFEDGTELPLLGHVYRLRHSPSGRRGVWIGDGEIHVSGQMEHFSRRLTDWLKHRAREEFTTRSKALAATIGTPIGTIHLKDTRSRWGSCNSHGDLAFSWRLLLAPADVLLYVAAHEVAHLREMNHSAAFWRLVSSMVPDPQTPRLWLKRHGAQLHRYGRSQPS
jgi:hypothetical protein